MAKKSQTKINSGEVSEQFSKDKHKYDTLGTNLVQALKLFLDEKDLKVLSVDFRTKDKDSFVEKIERKNCENPFDDIEDICGIRIICYYQSDVDKIAEIIKQEFEILENQDKEQLLEADQFGYRSTHFIVKIKSEWLRAPNYRNLENLKAEIQIRTVLMHAWAEIEHKLAYKKESHIPDKFRRKFSRLSAKLEEADEQFEELRIEVANYQQEIVDTVQNKTNVTKKIELNLDSLQAFLNAVFPDRIKSIKHTTRLVDELLNYKTGITEFMSFYEKVITFLPDIEKETFGDESELRWAQSGIVRQIMRLNYEDYHKMHSLPNSVLERDQKWREIIKKAETNKNEI